jgi:two-component system, NarL family, sensor histidine kinase DegS
MSEHGGAARISPYTRPTMETGIRGDRRADVDALYAEAQQALTQSANRLRTLTERLRELHAVELQEARRPAVAGSGNALEADRDQQAMDTARAGQLLGRLELITRDLEDGWRFLERGQGGEWSATARASADQLQIERPANLVEARLVLEAQEQERTRLAEELHDGPAQTLSNAVFRVRIVERAMRSDPSQVDDELAALGTMLERETERLRDFIRQLRPALQDAGDLASVLTDAANQLRDEAGIGVAVELTAPEEMLDVPARTAALRVALEALRNVRKHSGATQVRLITRLEAHAEPSGHNWWVLEVQDDGRGFSIDEVAEQTGRRHFGLRFMRERAQLVGGWLEIVSETAAGTTVRLRLDPRERSRQSW